MKLIITYLMTVLLGYCHGQSSGNCPNPVFKNHNGRLSTYDCYQYNLPIIEYGDKVTMSVNVSEDNLTLIWSVTINDNTEVIDKYNDLYQLEEQNKTLVWPSAGAGFTVFKVTAINSCGRRTTACFFVRLCKKCDIPTVSPETKTEMPHENLTFNITSTLVTNSEFSKFYWCFVGADSNSTSACCMCGEQCSESDWTTHPLVKNTCGSCEYRCLLVINQVSIKKYNGGKIFSGLRYFGRNTTLTIRHLEVIPQLKPEPSSQTEPTTQTRQSRRVYYIIGSGAGIVVIIFLTIVVMYKIKCHNNSRYYRVQTAVEQSPSPSLVGRRGSTLSNDSTSSSDISLSGSTEQIRVV